MQLNVTIVYSNCEVELEFNGFEYVIHHGDEGIRAIGSNCSSCYCNDGQFEDCYPIDCPFVSDPDAVRSCTINGTSYFHLESFNDDCNMCVCINGNVICTKLTCDDDEDSDDTAACRNSLHKPVCGINLRTYPNRCAAEAAGLNQLEILPGACTREVSIYYIIDTWLYITSHIAYHISTNFGRTNIWRFV